MSYQNRKNTSASVRIILKTPVKTSVITFKFDGIKEDDIDEEIEKLIDSIHHSLYENI